MISITVNGKQERVEQNQTIADLLLQLGLAEKRVAVELNREIVPRKRHLQTALADQDSIEIVSAIGGG